MRIASVAALAAFALWLAALPPALAQERFPAYARAASLQGSLQLSGSSVVTVYARAWGAAFQRMYPGVSVNVVAKSSGAAIGDMAANPAVIGMTSRALTAAERSAYLKQAGQAPREFRAAVDAVAIYVFRDNPLKSVTLPQLARIYGGSANLTTWGELGLQGEWAPRPIVPVGFEAGRGAYEIMRELVLRGGAFHAGVAAEPVSTSVVQAVGVDAGAIGYASIYFRTARTRVLPVQNDKGELAQPDETDAASGKYPLARYLYLHLGAGATDTAREFMRFVLSEEGQTITRNTGAFAISPELARAQFSALGAR